MTAQQRIRKATASGVLTGLFTLALGAALLGAVMACVDSNDPDDADDSEERGSTTNLGT